ncbi:hypothetical protein CYMTET_29933, partial [Cymbomonas tetramitiformis]
LIDRVRATSSDIAVFNIEPPLPSPLRILNNEQPELAAARYARKYGVEFKKHGAFMQQVRGMYQQLADQGRVPAEPLAFYLEHSLPAFHSKGLT